MPKPRSEIRTGGASEPDPEALIAAIYSGGGRENLPGLREDLASYGVNLGALEKFVGNVLHQAETARLGLVQAGSSVAAPPALSSSGALEPSWLERARLKRLAFEARLKSAGRKFSGSRETIQAVLNGELGLGLQRQAQVFFRSRHPHDLNQYSDIDLLSLIQDFQLLEELNEPDRTRRKP